MSHSARMEERFRRRLVIRRSAATIYLLSCIAYLTWRLTIFNPHAMTLSTMYFVADVFAVVLGAIAIFVSWHYRHREPPPTPVGMTVDVFIPVYKEPVEMVRRTLQAVRKISYSHEAYLLDDGRRPELRALAAELGCHYVTRPDNAHAKAGNLNHALAKTNGDFVAVFDVDHIPQPHALDVTLGFFMDPQVALVQSPQDYFNIDALQYANNESSGALWHDQSFFYNISQPGRDFHEAASCAGTSVVYRRRALEEIGGIPTDTITEDLHTSLKLHKRGHKVVFLNEPIAYGVAAADLADYYRTRHRYGHGNIHALRIENILFCSGLGWRQRLSYLFLGLIYLEGWQQLLVFLVPSLALIFGIAPFEITIFNVLVVMLFPLWTYALMQEVGCGFSRYWTNEVFSMIRWPVHIIASLALFRSESGWRPSRKDVKGEVEWRLLAPQLSVIALSIGALAVGVWRLAQNFSTGPLIAVVVDRVPTWDSVHAHLNALVAEAGLLVAQFLPGDNALVVAANRGAAAAAALSAQALNAAPPPPIAWFTPLTTGYTLDLVLVAGFWAVVNAARGIFVVAKVVRNARTTRDDYAFRSLLPVEVLLDGSRLLGVAERLSCSEIRLSKPLRRALLQAAGPVVATLFLPDGPIEIAVGTPQRRGGGFRPYAASAAARARVEACLYAVSWHREFLHHDAEFATPLSTLGRIFTFGRMGRRAGVRWQEAGLAAAGDGSEPFPVVLQGNRRRAVETVVAFRPLAVGATYRVTTAASAGPRSRMLTIGAAAAARTAVAPEGTRLRTYRYGIVKQENVALAESVPIRQPVVETTHAMPEPVAARAGADEIDAAASTQRVRPAANQALRA